MFEKIKNAIKNFFYFGDQDEYGFIALSKEIEAGRKEYNKELHKYYKDLKKKSTNELLIELIKTIDGVERF